MRGDRFHFAYVLAAGDRVVHIGAGAVAAPDAEAVSAYLLRTHGSHMFWDWSDHQFCPTASAADELVTLMRLGIWA